MTGMIDLNLLSPKSKKEIRSIKTFFIIKTISFRVASLLLLISTVLIFSFFLLNIQIKSLDSLLELELDIKEKEKIASIGEATKDLNQQINLASSVQNEYILWTEFISNFTQLVPDGIIIKTVNFNNLTNSFSVTGIADTREALLEFEERLDQSVYFENIVSPISNLTQRESINFDISASLTDNIYENF